ncbi:MAG: hypothetical protein KAH31_10035, partial [Candidatus Sabulitectum sp.]|nr:hypothetical protein [Candidatus Sabulitectum sp.]
MMKLEAPKTKIVPFTENLHGRVMVDDYRWLETAGEDRASWIEQQNSFVDNLVLDHPKRHEFSKRFNELFNYDRTGFPASTLSRIFYRKIKRGE